MNEIRGFPLRISDRSQLSCTLTEKRRLLPFAFSLLEFSKACKRAGSPPAWGETRPLPELLSVGFELVRSGMEIQSLGRLLDGHICLANQGGARLVELLMIREAIVSISLGDTPQMVASNLASFFAPELAQEACEMLLLDLKSQERLNEEWLASTRSDQPPLGGLATFEENVDSLSNGELGVLLAHLNFDDIAAALRGVSGKTLERVALACDLRTRSRLRETFEGGLNRPEITEAQTSILLTMERLRREGQLGK